MPVAQSVAQRPGPQRGARLMLPAAAAPASQPSRATLPRLVTPLFGAVLLSLTVGGCDRLKTADNTKTVPNPPAQSALDAARDTARSVGESISKEARETAKDIREGAEAAAEKTRALTREAAEKTRAASQSAVDQTREAGRTAAETAKEAGRDVRDATRREPSPNPPRDTPAQPAPAPRP